MPEFDKTKLLLAGFYLWTYALYYITSVVNDVLYGIIKYAPDNIVYDLRHFYKSPEKINIISAAARNVNTDEVEITNKLKLLMNLRWDKTDNYIDLDKMAEVLNAAIIVITYILNYKDEQKNQYITVAVEMLINFKESKIYRHFVDGSIDNEDLVFGEVAFY